jgi:hypothetical protein
MINRQKPALLRTLQVGLLLAIVFLPLRAYSQADQPPAEKAPETKTEIKKPADKPLFNLKISNEHVLAISLDADGVRLKDIAAELSRELKIPVILSPVMQKQTATAKYRDLLLEPAMQLLAPVVFIDYQIDSAPGARPKPLGIFLDAYNEPAPARDAVVKSNTQGFAVSGNTEDTGDEDDDSDPIKVSQRNGKLTAKAKEQPLLDVMSQIADEINVPFEGPEDSKELVTIDIKDQALEEAILHISPHIRLFVRADLFRATRTVLRIVVVPGDKSP